MISVLISFWTNRMCLDRHVYLVSKYMHLTQLMQADWVIRTWIINEFEKDRFHCHATKTAGLIRRSQVAGHRSHVARRTSQVTGCSVRRYNKKHFSHIQPFSSNKHVLFKVCTASESLMVVVFYSWILHLTATKSNISLNCNTDSCFSTTSWLTCLQKNSQKFEKMSAILNFHERKWNWNEKPLVRSLLNIKNL